MDIDTIDFGERLRYFNQFSKEHLGVLSIFGSSVKKSNSIEDTIDIANEILWKGLSFLYDRNVESQIYIFRKECMQRCQSLFKSSLEGRLKLDEKIFIPIRFDGDGEEGNGKIYGDDDDDDLLGVIIVEDSNKIDDINKEFLIEYSKRVGITIYRNHLFNMLERQNLERVEFSAQVAHDLNNCLTGVRGFSEVILDKVNELDFRGIDGIRDIETLKICAQQIYDNSIRIEDIVNLLSFDEISPKIVKSNTENLNLYEFMRESFKNHLAINGDIYLRNNFILSVDNDFVDKYFKLDKSIFTIIFDNLIGNASKYTPQGGVILSSVYNQNDDLKLDFLNTVKAPIPSEDLSRLSSKGNRGNLEVQIHDIGLNYGFGLYMIEKVVRNGFLGSLSLSSGSSLDVSQAFNIDLKKIDFFGCNPISYNILDDFFRVEISIPKEMIQ